MKTCFIVVNNFLKSEKFSRLYEFFTESAKKHNIDAKMLTNKEVVFFLENGGEHPDFVIFWDKDIRVAKYLELKGIPIFNSSEGIRISDDKYLTYLALEKMGIPTPKTIIAPMTFENIGYTDYDFIKSAAEILGFPMVIKEVFGSFGQQVYLADDYDKALSIIKNTNCRPVLFQKYIEFSKGRDIRINVVGDEVIASMERRSTDGDFRANLTRGGIMKEFIPDDDLKKLAIKSAKAAGLDFCGIDFLFTPEGFTVCEINSNAHFKNIYDLTGVNTADKIFEYILEKKL